MKVPYLILASLFATTARADADNIFVLAIKDEDHDYVPLSGFPQQESDISWFGVNDPPHAPLEISFEINKAYVEEGKTRHVVGFHEGRLAYNGEGLEGTEFEIGQWGKINRQFSLCKDFNPNLHFISNNLDKNYGHVCHKVDIYFLEYNKKTKSVMKPAKVTNVFVVKVAGHNGGNEIKLTKGTSNEQGGPSAFLSYGVNHLVLEFAKSEDKISATNIHSSADLRKFEGRLVLGGDDIGTPAKLEIDGKGKVKGDYSSCKIQGSQNEYEIIYDKSTIKAQDCQDAELFFLTYDERLKKIPTYDSLFDYDLLKMAEKNTNLRITSDQNPSQKGLSENKFDKNSMKKPTFQGSLDDYVKTQFPEDTHNSNQDGDSLGSLDQGLERLPFDKSTNMIYSNDPLNTSPNEPLQRPQPKEAPSNTNSNSEKNDSYVSSDIPLVFTLKLSDSYIPLYAKSVDNMNGKALNQVNVFTYGQKTKSPIFFTLQDGYAISADKQFSGQAGFTTDVIAFGSRIPKFRFRLNNEKRIVSDNFYSCVLTEGFVAVAKSKLNKDCLIAEVYLLEWDEKTNQVIPPKPVNSKDEELLPWNYKKSVPEEERKSVKEDDKEHILSVEETEENSEESSKSKVLEVNRENKSQGDTVLGSLSKNVIMASGNISNTPAQTPEPKSVFEPNWVASSAATGKRLKHSVKSSVSGAASNVSAPSYKISGGSDKVSKGGQGPKGNALPTTEETTATATVCNECKAASQITVWKTYTDYTTYCPQETTLTITVCEKVCTPTTVTVHTPTTLTVTGICVVTETVTLDDTATEYRAVIEADSSTAESPKETSGNKGPVPKGSTRTGEYNPQSHVQDIKVGDQKLKNLASSNAEEVLASNAKSPSPKGLAEADKARLSGNKASKAPHPKANKESKAIKTENTKPGVSSFVNGATKNSIGACVLGFAALLL